jgi:hypothetical protein
VKHKEGIAITSETLSNTSASQKEYLLSLSEEKTYLTPKASASRHGAMALPKEKLKVKRNG